MNHRLDSLLHKSNLNIIEEGDVDIASQKRNKLTEETELRQSILTALNIQLSSHRKVDFDFVTDYKLLTPF